MAGAKPELGARQIRHFRPWARPQQGPGQQRRARGQPAPAARAATSLINQPGTSQHKTDLRRVGAETFQLNCWVHGVNGGSKTTHAGQPSTFFFLGLGASAGASAALGASAAGAGAAASGAGAACAKPRQALACAAGRHGTGHMEVQTQQSFVQYLLLLGLGGIRGRIRLLLRRGRGGGSVGRGGSLRGCG